MKKYVENKNFLPLEYTRKMNLEIEKRKRKDCIILLIMCMALLPHTVSVLINRNKNVIIDDTNYYQEENIDTYDESKNESLNNSLKYINKIIEGNLNNGRGEIYVEGNEKLADFINNTKITVNNIESLDGDRFRIEIDEQ